ncbi:MAG: DUF2934 domain-containing protein [Bauldia sp.]|nr:DUF2934 domain-containing protein [Bauldia sp.]
MITNESAVRVRAYEIWEAEGRPDGRETEHWLKALHEMAATMAAPARKKAAPKKADKAEDVVVDIKAAAPKKRTKKAEK